MVTFIAYVLAILLLISGVVWMIVMIYSVIVKPTIDVTKDVVDFMDKKNKKY